MRSQARVPLSLISIDYTQIRSVAYDSVYVYFDSSSLQKLFISSGVTAPIYETKNITVATGFESAVFGDTVEFILPKSLLFTNVSYSNLEFDFGDGAGFVSASVDVPYLKTYSQTVAWINFKIKITVGGKTIIIQFPFKKEPEVEKPGAIWEFEYQLYNPCSIPTPHGTTWTNTYIRYADDNVIQKPLIILEGFDPSTKMKKNKWGKWEFGDLGWSGWITGYFPDAKGENAYPQLNLFPTLLDGLRSRGYDVFIVDFSNGGNDIRTNAATVINLIQYINAVKVGKEEIVLIGGSMGGLIARYALKTMEDYNCNHCTKALMTLDSPHEGANIPIGVQYWLQYFAAISDDADEKYWKTLNSKAARQLLIYQTFPLDDRTTWQTEYNNLGYPSRCRLLAAANGSKDNTSWPFPGGAQLVSYNPGGGLRGDVWAVNPGIANHKVFHGKAWAKGTWGMYRTAEVEKFVSYYLGYDNAPSGGHNSPKQLADAKAPIGNISNPDGTNRYIAGFVPTISSLDINTLSLNYNVSQNMSEDNPDPTMTPFEMFQSPSGTNERHVELTNQKITWLYDRLAEMEFSGITSLTSSYNFGISKGQFLTGMNIGSGGILKVNAFEKIKYGSTSDPVTQEGTEFTLRTATCDNHVTIKNDGQMIIGDDNSLPNKGYVYFKKGSILEIEGGGTLIIHDGSKLVIEEGATLIYHDEASIVLNGDNALLEIRGSVLVKSNANFTFTHTTTNSGYIRFKKTSNSTLSISCEGTGATISFEGTGCNDKILEIENCTVVPSYSTISSSNYFNKVTIKKGTILYGSYGVLKIGSPLEFSEMNLKANPSTTNHTGLHTLGQATPTFSTLNIVDVTFDGLNIGHLSEPSTYGNPVSISGCRFFGGNTGFQQFGESYTIYNSLFRYQANYGVNSSIEDPSEISLCIFRGSESTPTGYGVSFTNDNTSSLYLEDVSFQKLQYGLHTWNTGAIATVKCCYFIDNTYGIRGESAGGEMNLSSVKTINSNTGGGCTFTNNTYGIVLDQSSLYLQDGFNNFSSTNSTSPQFIYAWIPQNQAQLSGTSLDADDNYFSPSLISDPDFYDVHYINIHPTAVTLVNTETSAVSTGCTGFSMNVTICGFAVHKTTPTINAAPQTKAQTGVDELSGSERVSVYPNPTNSQFTVKIDGRITFMNVTVYDLTGRVIMKESKLTESNTQTFDLTDLPDGMYFVEVNTDQGTTRVALILKR